MSAEHVGEAVVKPGFCDLILVQDLETEERAGISKINKKHFSPPQTLSAGP